MLARRYLNGGAVKSAAGYIVEGQGSAAPVVGVLNGVFYNAATTLKPLGQTTTRFNHTSKQ